MRIARIVPVRPWITSSARLVSEDEPARVPAMPRPPRTSPTLSPEVVDHIFSYLHDDPTSLLSCALAGRGISIPARWHLAMLRNLSRLQGELQDAKATLRSIVDEVVFDASEIVDSHNDLRYYEELRVELEPTQDASRFRLAILAMDITYGALDSQQDHLRVSAEQAKAPLRAHAEIVARLAIGYSRGAGRAPVLLSSTCASCDVAGHNRRVMELFDTVTRYISALNAVPSLFEFDSLGLASRIVEVEGDEYDQDA
jgi:hypothetical protein